MFSLLLIVTYFELANILNNKKAGFFGNFLQNKNHPVGWFFVLARLAGFEPATYRFVAGHSIH